MVVENVDEVRFPDGVFVYQQGVFMYNKGVFMYLKVCPPITTLSFLPTAKHHGFRYFRPTGMSPFHVLK